METWRGTGDRGRYRKGHSRPVVFRDPDSFENDRLELGRDAAEAWALETVHPRLALARRLRLDREEV